MDGVLYTVQAFDVVNKNQTRNVWLLFFDTTLVQNLFVRHHQAVNLAGTNIDSIVLQCSAGLNFGRCLLSNIS